MTSVDRLLLKLFKRELLVIIWCLSSSYFFQNASFWFEEGIHNVIYTAHEAAGEDLKIVFVLFLYFSDFFFISHLRQIASFPLATKNNLQVKYLMLKMCVL